MSKWQSNVNPQLINPQLEWQLFSKPSPKYSNPNFMDGIETINLHWWFIIALLTSLCFYGAPRISSEGPWTAPLKTARPVSPPKGKYILLYGTN